MGVAVRNGKRHKRLFEEKELSPFHCQQQRQTHGYGQWEWDCIYHAEPLRKRDPESGRLLAAWLAWYTNPNHIAQGRTATLELLPKGHWGISAQEKEGCLMPASCCGAA